MTDDEILAAYLSTERNAAPFDEAAWSGSVAGPAFTLARDSARIFMLQSMQTTSAASGPFRVLAGYSDATAANAVAAYRSGLHLCILNRGLVTRLLDLAFQALATPGVLAEGSSPEPSAPSHSSRSVPWLLAPAPVQDDWALPRDPERFALAEDLAQLLLRFVWLHELHHGVNGHVLFLGQYLPAPALQEVPEPGLVQRAAASAITPAAMRLLELDADRSALWSMLMVQFHDQEHIPTIAARPLFERARLTLLASFIMVALFAEAGDARIEPALRTHPDASARLHNLLRLAASHWPDGPLTFAETVEACMPDCDALHRLWPGIPPARQLLAELRSAAVQSPLDNLEDELDALRKRLAPFAFHQP